MTTSIHTTRRRGAFYFFALFLALLVSTMLLGLSALVATGRHTLQTLARSDQALLAARAGVEHVLGMASDDPDWRTNRPNGAWLTDVPFAGATYTVAVVDEDGSLTDDPDDDVVITATGTHESATRTIRVRARPVAINALSTSIVAEQVLNLKKTVITSDAGLYSNDRITSSNQSTINADLFAASTIALSGATLTGSAITPIAPRELPAPSVIDYYAGLATPISRLALPTDAKGFLLERVVLSPTNNPFGAPNPRGVYLIDLGNVDDLTIRDCRIEGTLLIRNPWNRVTLRGGLVARSAYGNYPALMIDAVWRRVDMDLDATLSESETSTNFNPIDTPFAAVADSDQIDTYASVIEGIMVSMSEMTIKGTLDLRGTLVQVGPTLKFDRDVQITVDQSPWLAEHPPPRFRSHRLRMVPGTWRLVTPAP